VADLLLSALVMPFAIVNDLSGIWIFGKDYCNLWIATDVMCCTASITSLLAISLERYYTVRHLFWITSGSASQISATQYEISQEKKRIFFSKII
jgi:hypothetical protein